jgi:P4 family phage/plasmid primase-like protien
MSKNIKKEEVVMFKVKSKITTKKIDQCDPIEYFKQYKDAPTSTLFEVIHGNAVKPYFDYDEVMDSDKTIEKLRNKRLKEIIEITKDYFDDGEIIQVFDASGYNPVKKEWKISFRVIVQNHGLYDNGEIIKEMIIPYLTTENIKWDTSVYKKLDKMQLLLLPYHCKEGNENRMFKKVDIEKDSYPLISIADISAKEFALYFIQNKMGTDGEELDRRVFDETEEDSSEEDSAEDTEEDSVEDTEEDEDTGPIYTYEELNELIKCLDYEGQDWDWGFWRNLMWCLSNISQDYGVDLKMYAHSISAECKKYDPKYTNEIYDQSKRRKGEHRLAIGSLIKWAEKINPEKLKTWQQKQYAKNILYSPFTDGDINDYLIYECNGKFKLYKSNLYYFNDVYWKESSINVVYAKMDEIYWNLKKKLNQIEKKLDKEKQEAIIRNLQKLRSQRCLKNVFDMFKIKVEISDDIFDKNIDLLGFVNGTYDLKTGEFREPRREDYITKIIPYNYAKSDWDDIQFVTNHFKKIFPIEEERNLFFRCIASGLRGATLERFIILTGKGGNSKDSVCTYILPETLGDYYYRCNNSAITQKIKGDMNVSVSQMNKKRIIIYNEPHKDETIKTSIVKELTGGKSISFRSLYESKADTVNLMGTHIMMCNDKPLLDHVDCAIARRLIIIPFRSSFKNAEDIKRDVAEDTEYVYEGNNNVKSQEFINKIKLPFLNILLEHYKEFQRDGYDIKNIPKSCQLLAQDYMNESNEFSGWFLSKYELTNNDNDYIKIGEIYREYRCSDLYQNLNRREKRTMNRDKFIKNIEDNPTLRLNCRKRFHRSGIDVNAPVMIRYKEKVHTEENEE